MSKSAARIVAARRNPHLAVLEGFHAVKHALRFGAEPLVLVTPDPTALLAMAESLAPDLVEELSAAETIDAGDFLRLTARPVPTPALAVARRPAVDVVAVLSGPGPVVLLEDPRHLGNVGAAVRVAAAAGAAGVLTTGDRDPWDPAALRGSAGLHYAVPVAHLEALPKTDRPLVALDPAGEPLGTLPERPIVAFGTERSGLSEKILKRADRRLAIPMRPGVSSLNLATAVAVVLYGTTG
jgi:TrmH family RNA methyltransferase